MGDAGLLSELEGKLRQDFESKYLDAKQKLAACGEKLATDMLAAETVKLRNLMNGPHASVDAVESELHRCALTLDMFVVVLAGGLQPGTFTWPGIAHSPSTRHGKLSGLAIAVSI